MSSNSKGAIPKDKSNLSNNTHRNSKNNLSDKALNRSIDSALTVNSADDVLEMKMSLDNETIIKEKSSKKSCHESSRESSSGYVLEAKAKYPRLPPNSNDNHEVISPLANAILSYENVL